MKPQPGKAGSLVSPAEPAEAQEADKADPGEAAQMKAEQIQAQAGKYGSEKVRPHQPPSNAQEKKEKPHWIEIELVDQDGKPVAGEKYKVKLPDGSEDSGTLSAKGIVRIEGIADAGDCEITFPDLEKTAWEPA